MQVNTQLERVCVYIYMYFTYLATHARPGITGCLRGEGGWIEEGRKAQRGEGTQGGTEHRGVERAATCNIDPKPSVPPPLSVYVCVWCICVGGMFHNCR